MKQLIKKIPLFVFVFLFFFSVSSFNQDAKADCPVGNAQACIAIYQETFFYPCLAHPDWWGFSDSGPCYQIFVMELVPSCYTECGGY